MSSPTICAISTPTGVGGIAVIRVSGTDAISIVDSIFRGKRQLSEQKGNTITYGRIYDGGELLDEVLVSVFRSPHSFTGEDVIEISCHGSLYVQQQMLQVLIKSGCSMAQAGEFTQRAFLNGKIDLTKAEAVADLISSQTKAAHHLALSHLRGSVSSRLNELRNQLLTLTALLELELDFADHEDVEFADRRQLLSLSTEISDHLSLLLQSFTLGNAIKNGINVAIIGSTNVGKSTLLNCLLQDDRAIVTDEAGTTRDTIEETIVIDGILFRFIDTAGIRQTSNMIESIGIERSRKAAEQAQLVIVLHDSTKPDNDDYAWLDENKVWHVYNKMDLVSNPESFDGIRISAKTGDIAELMSALHSFAAAQDISSQVVISNARHYEALQKAKVAILRVISALNDNLSEELIALDLHDCLNALGSITGEITNDEVLSTIFSRFCIGK